MATVKSYLYWTNPTSPTSKYGKSYFLSSSSDMATEGWFLIKEIELEFDEPTHADAAPIVVFALEKKIQTMRADTEMREQEVREEINNLLCLEA